MFVLTQINDDGRGFQVTQPTPSKDKLHRYIQKFAPSPGYRYRIMTAKQCKNSNRIIR